MAVVILGDTDLFKEYELVRRAVERLGAEPTVVETQHWPGDPPVEYTVDGGEVVLGEPIQLDSVSGVFTMNEEFEIPDPGYYGLDGKDDRVSHRQIREWRSHLRSMLSVFEEYGANVTTSPAESHWNRLRPWMLELYEDNAVPVPATTFSNDPDGVREFVEEHAPVVVQSVNGGRPELMEPADLDPERLQKLSAAPIKVQEYVPGTDTRGYVVDGEFAGMVRYEYDSDAISFKSPEVDYGDVETTRIDPRPELRRAVMRAAELTPSAFTAVDVRVSDGDFQVLESNTPGRFAHHDSTGETDVSGALAEYLVGA